MIFCYFFRVIFWALGLFMFIMKINIVKKISMWYDDTVLYLDRRQFERNAA